MAHDLLIEIGSEEIPARMLRDLAGQFSSKVLDGLRGADLLDPDARQQSWWTPRRLLVSVSGVRAQQSDRQEEVTGPPVRIAVGADGAYTPQATGFAAKFGLGPEAITRVSTPKGEYIAVRRTIKGEAAGAVLASLIPQALAAVELPRSMKWAPGVPFRFIRPLRWLNVLLGNESVPVQVAGLTSGAASRGHRTLGASSIAIDSPTSLPAQLEKNFVLADPERRRQRIEQGIADALQGSGLRVRPDAALLETLINLTEFPSVVKGEFAADYLDLPAEVLVTVMRDHQKYFAVEDQQGKLAHFFLAIMDLDRDRDGLIRHGHERVLRARFNDARFFWHNDRKRPLASRLEDLKHVTFQAVLGNYFEKSRRNARLAATLARDWPCDQALTERAALWAKCDLTSELVKEFTELQGIMGGLYAQAEGEDARLADAIYDQYLPVAVDGAAPRNLEGVAVGIADKLDTIAGMFAAGEIPSGSRDPFALRRQANGVLRTLMVHGRNLDLVAALQAALAGYNDVPAVAARAQAPETLEELKGFFCERIEFYLREVEGFAYDTVAALLSAAMHSAAVPSTAAPSAAGQPALDPVELRRRGAALEQARNEAPEQFARVAAALKRMRNIVRKEGGQEQWSAVPVDASLLVEADEKTLYQRIQTNLSVLGDREQLQHLFRAIADLWEPLDQFFNTVRVNAEDARLRANRLALLAWAVAELSRVDYLSQIVLAGE